MSVSLNLGAVGCYDVGRAKPRMTRNLGAVGCYPVSIAGPRISRNMGVVLAVA